MSNVKDFAENRFFALFLAFVMMINIMPVTIAASEPGFITHHIGGEGDDTLTDLYYPWGGGDINIDIPSGATNHVINIVHYPYPHEYISGFENLIVNGAVLTITGQPTSPPPMTAPTSSPEPGSSDDDDDELYLWIQLNDTEVMTFRDLELNYTELQIDSNNPVELIIDGHIDIFYGRGSSILCDARENMLTITGGADDILRASGIWTSGSITIDVQTELSSNGGGYIFTTHSGDIFIEKPLAINVAGEAVEGATGGISAGGNIFVNATTNIEAGTCEHSFGGKGIFFHEEGNLYLNAHLTVRGGSGTQSEDDEVGLYERAIVLFSEDEGSPLGEIVFFGLSPNVMLTLQDGVNAGGTNLTFVNNSSVAESIWRAELVTLPVFIPFSAFLPEINGRSELTVSTDAVFENATAIYLDTLPEKYRVDVIGSYSGDSGEGEYEAGETVTIDAGELAGYIFNGWTVTSGGAILLDATGASTTFEMPAENVEVTANWLEAADLVLYDVTVIGSYAAVSGAGQYAAENIVTIDAGARGGYTFAGWTVTSGSAILLNPGSVSTTFEMPEEDIEVTAGWQPISGGIVNIVTDGGSVNLGDPARTPAQTPEPGTPTQPEVPERPVLTDDHVRYLHGYPDGSVRPESNITRAEAASIFFHLIVDPNKEAPRTASFSDVSAGAWYYHVVAYMQERGILTGYPDGTFAPDSPMTRAEFAALASIFDNLELNVPNIFSDVNENHWAVDYINSATAKGWVSGFPDGSFRPDEFITRAQVVAIINQMLNRRIRVSDIPPDAPGYSDINASHWAYADIMEASFNHTFTCDDDGYETWINWEQ